MTEYELKQSAIADTERKGRYIVNSWFVDNTLKNGWNVVDYTNNNQSNPIDLHYTITKGVELALFTRHHTTVTMDCNIEVKTRIQDADSLERYPNAILKVDKYNAMRQAIQDKPNAALFYAVVLNDSTLYVYDITDIEKVPHTVKNLPLKRIQYLDGSEVQETPCFLLNYDTACRTVDISQYVTKYNAINPPSHADNIPS